MANEKMTAVGRVSFPNVFDPKPIGDNGDPQFTMDLIFEANDPWIKKLEKELDASAKEKWPKGKPKNWESCIKDGDTQEDKPEYHGKVFISVKAKADRQPTVVDKDKSLITKESGKFYGGCWARITYNVYSWEYLKKHGTSIGLNNIQKCGDGTPFGGGRTTAEEDFDEFEGDIPFADNEPDDDDEDNDLPF